MSAKRGVHTLCAPSAFFATVTESLLPIRTSHPSGSRHWGFPRERETDTRPLAARSPGNSSVPCHGQVLRIGFHRSRPGAMDGVCPSRAGGNLAIRLHRSLAPARGRVQPLAGFMTEAHRYKSFALRQFGRDATAANQFWWLSANPMASSPPQPDSYPFMRMPCSRRRPPDRAGCSSRPLRVCGRPS